MLLLSSLRRYKHPRILCFELIFLILYQRTSVLTKIVFFGDSLYITYMIILLLFLAKFYIHNKNNAFFLFSRKMFIYI